MASGLPPIAIVVSRYNGEVTSRLLQGATRQYAALGGRERDLVVIEAAGAFEVATLAHYAARHAEKGGASGARVAGVVAIGCIVKGETIHDEVLAQAVTMQLLSTSTQTGVPVGLAVLTVNTPAQALERAGGALGNKGEEAMLAVLQTLAATARLRDRKLGGLKRVPSPGATSASKTRGAAASASSATASRPPRRAR